MKQKITKDTVIVGNSFNAQCEKFIADIKFGGWENPQNKNEEFFEKPKSKYHK